MLTGGEHRLESALVPSQSLDFRLVPSPLIPCRAWGCGKSGPWEPRWEPAPRGCSSTPGMPAGCLAHTTALHGQESNPPAFPWQTGQRLVGTCPGLWHLQVSLGEERPSATAGNVSSPCISGSRDRAIWLHAGRPPRALGERALPAGCLLCPTPRISGFVQAIAGFDHPGNYAALPAPQGKLQWEQSAPGPVGCSQVGSLEPQCPWACDSDKVRPDPDSGGPTGILPICLKVSE